MNIIVLAVFVSVVFLAITAAIAKSRAAGVALLGVFAAAGSIYYGSYESPQNQVPVEFVADRLAHEANAIGQEAALPLNSQVENRESTAMLRRLHHRQSSNFVASPGFGFGRSRISLELWNALTERAKPEPSHLPDETPDQLHVPLAVERQDRLPNKGLFSGFHLPEADMLQRLHDEQSSDFVTANGFGFSRMVSPAVLAVLFPDEQEPPYTPAVTPDHFHVPLAVERQDRLPNKGLFSGFHLPEPKPDWQLVRLELVSLLKHESPVAYVSQHLPQMDELKDAPTRPLDDFERGAIERLRSDEDLVIDDAPNRIRMVGSLRAGKDCMECHSVRRGELLGAFSYVLIGGRVERRLEPGA